MIFIVCSRCRSFTIVNVFFFSLSVVSRIHLVLGTDHPNLFQASYSDTVWDGRATDKKFRLENRFAPEYAQTMICSCSLNSHSIATVGPSLQFSAQALPNDVLIPIVRCRENRR